MNVEKEKHGQSNVADSASSGSADKSRLPRDLAVILGAAAILIAGTALLLVPVYGGPQASGKYQSELTTVFFDPILPYPAAIIESLTKNEAIRPEAATAAAKISSALAGAPAIKFEQGSSLLVISAKAGTKAGTAAAARAVFDYLVAAYSAHPARQAAFSAYMAARDVGNIRLFGRALAEQALMEVPVAVTILNSETKPLSSGFTIMSIVLLVASIGFMLIYVTKEGRREYLKLSRSAESTA